MADGSGDSLRIETPSGARSLETAGFALIEMAVVMVVLAVVLGSVWSALLHTDLFSAQRTRELVVTQMGWKIMDRLEELQGAVSASVSPVVLEDSDWISFRKVESHSEAGPVLSEPITFAYRVESGEALNGIDDDGDGRVDEGVIEYTSGNPAVDRTNRQQRGGPAIQRDDKRRRVLGGRRPDGSSRRDPAANVLRADHVP